MNLQEFEARVAALETAVQQALANYNATVGAHSEAKNLLELLKVALATTAAADPALASETTVASEVVNVVEGAVSPAPTPAAVSEAAAPSEN